VLLVLNVAPRLCIAVAAVCFLSFIGAARDFASYQSDGMLLEAAFISFFLAPRGLRPREQHLGVLVILRQCCAPACNGAQLSSKRRNDDQVDSKFFAGLSHNPLKSLALLGPVSIFES
jgi:hypothetical protein